MKAFLGGTCNESEWRDRLIPLLTIDYFNPVVDDWNEEAMRREIQEREECDFCLYVITPKMSGFYSIAEVVDDSNKRPEKTVLGVMSVDDGLTFSREQRKSLHAVEALIRRNGCPVFFSLSTIADYLNGKGEDL
jgi:hypothetical protein